MNQLALDVDERRVEASSSNAETQHDAQGTVVQAGGGASSPSASAHSSSTTATAADSGDDNNHKDSPGVQAALALLRWYKGVLSPMMQSTCRFLPTCSQYSIDSYKAYGVARGTVLTAWRLLRCNPWGPSGYDPTTWPPPGLEVVFKYQYSAEAAVVLGTCLFYRFMHALIFE
eukprot:gene12549-12681_t